MDTPWNELCPVKLEDYLTDDRTEEDKVRMTAMGNLVVPLQGHVGMSILSNMCNLPSYV